jgi:hypothetical protein
MTSVSRQHFATSAPLARGVGLIRRPDSLPFGRQCPCQRSGTWFGDGFQLLLHESEKMIGVGAINDAMIE